MAAVADALEVHASPEAFISSRLADETTRSGVDGSVVRTKILDRNVTIVTTYEAASKLMSDPTHRSYSLFTMDSLFPSPSLSFSDSCPHGEVRGRWDQAYQTLAGAHSEHQAIARQWFSELPLAQDVQLYRTMKYLAWRLVLVSVLGVSPGGPDAREVQSLQQDILRGQFSKLPISINAGIWQSARHKGLQARERLQRLLRRRLDTHRPLWLPESLVASRPDEVVAQLMSMTSSLIVKSLASLLTALLLNWYLYEPTTGDKLEASLPHLLEETARLCPPLVGVMRRVTDDAVDKQAPKGWDLWAYLAGANRDPVAFGDSASRFDPGRYADPKTPAPLSFGAGERACPAAELVKSCCLATLESCASLGIKMTGATVRPGVQAWLGWQEAGAEAWARDMKQLPAQHPSEPVLVQFSRGHSDKRKSYHR